MLAALAPGRGLPFAPGNSRKRGPELSQGVKALASAAVERRKASGLPSIARFRAPRIGRRQRLSVWRGHWLDAPLGAPLPSFLGGRRIKRTLLLSWYANLGRASRRENEFLFRHCEERSDEAIQSFVAQKTGLLRFARNDENGNARSPHPLPASEARERNTPPNSFFAPAA